MLIALLSFWLPAMNYDRCDEPGNGFTCTDLENGIAVVKRMLNRTRTRQIMVDALNGVRRPAECIFVRIFNIAVALATDSVPVIRPITGCGAPDFAKIGELETRPKALAFCDNLTNLGDADSRFTLEELFPVHLILSPALVKLYSDIGPAALHILAHLALNISNSNEHRSYSASVKGANGAIDGLELTHYSGMDELVEAMGAAEFALPLPSITGWVVSLLRGRAPTLCDRVSQHCWRARNYTAGGVNPIYPGTKRSKLDIARANVACGETGPTRALINALI